VDQTFALHPGKKQAKTSKNQRELSFTEERVLRSNEFESPENVDIVAPLSTLFENIFTSGTPPTKTARKLRGVC